MGVLVRNMKIPKSCVLCDYRFAEAIGCEYCKNLKSDGRDANCPLVEMNSYGDLVDRNAVIKTVLADANSSENMRIAGTNIWIRASEVEERLSRVPSVAKSLKGI